MCVQISGMDLIFVNMSVPVEESLFNSFTPGKD